MKSYTLFNYEFLFGDHLAKCSNEAKLLYMKLNFYANNGFVANPLQVLDSLQYDKTVLKELIQAEEILTIPNRDEIFITSYFVHNYKVDVKSWLKTPYAEYWKGKLWIKQNRIATLKEYKPKQFDEKETPKEPEQESFSKTDKSWEELCDEIENTEGVKA